jgi:hypothetical protein
MDNVGHVMPLFRSSTMLSGNVAPRPSLQPLRSIAKSFKVTRAAVGHG